MSVACEVQTLAIRVDEWTLFILPRINRRTQIFGSTPLAIRRSVSAVNIQTTESSGAIARKIKNIPIWRNTWLAFPMLVRIDSFREFTNAVPHAVGKSGIIQITKLLTRALISLADGKSHEGVVCGHARATLVVLSVKWIF